MLKLVGLGMWLIIVTAGATFASTYLSRSEAGDREKPEDRGVEQVTSELTSIPIITGGDVVGYVILQLSFAADKALMDQTKVDALPYLRDSAFRVIFSNAEIDFRHLRPGDLDKLTAAIREDANRRLGVALVRQVLFQQLNYVRKEDIRTNWINGQNGSSGG